VISVLSFIINNIYVTRCNPATWKAEIAWFYTRRLVGLKIKFCFCSNMPVLSRTFLLLDEGCSFFLRIFGYYKVSAWPEYLKYMWCYLNSLVRFINIYFLHPNYMLF
jgi:hypothetical protein